MINLRIDSDAGDGFIYVREKVGRSWKQLFRSQSMAHVLRTLSIKYSEEDSAENKEKYLGRTTSKKPVEAV